MPDPTPQRGEIWWADFSPTRGREQRDRRPALVVSDDRFNDSAAGLVLLCPLTTTERPGVPWHIEVGTEADLPQRSFVMCEQVRSASRQRLSERAGTAPSSVMQQVEDRLRVLMGL
jgi:mRNA interferase MazF